MKHLSRIIMLILFCSAVSESQTIPQLQIVGRPERSADELIGKKDRSGRICAAIQVISDMEGFIYDSNNGVVEAVDGEGKDMVFLSPDERKLEIRHTGFEPLKIILSEIGIRLESNVVWVLKITGERKAATMPVVIITKPEGAEVTIDGQPAGTGKQFPLSLGSHQLRLQKTGYQPVIQTLFVDERNTLFEFTLEEEKRVVVELTSEPAGAAVIIDGMRIGITPVSDFLRTGRYPVRVEKEWYVPFEDMIEIASSGATRHFTLMPDFGSLQVSSMPRSGMTVFLNGENQNVATPHIFERLRPGIYRVQAKSGLYEGAEDTVEVKRGRKAEKTLEIRENFAVLTVKTAAGASVYLNDRKLDRLENVQVEPMIARLRVEMPPKGKPVEQRIELRRGERKEVELYPEIALGDLLVAVQPLDASIELFGDRGERFSAVRSHAFEKIPAGSYRVKVSAAGYGTKEETVILAAGESKKLSIGLDVAGAARGAEPVMKRKKSKWPYYVLATAAIGGGTVYYLTREKKATLVIDMPATY